MNFDQPTTPPSAPEPTDEQLHFGYRLRSLFANHASDDAILLLVAHDRKIAEEATEIGRIKGWEEAGATVAKNGHTAKDASDIRAQLAASREECARLGRALEEAAIHLEIVADSNPDHWAPEESRDRYAMEAAQMCRRNISTPPSATPAGGAEKGQS